MTRFVALRLLILLQLLAALAWPAQASTTDDVQHRALHSVLTQHGHEDDSGHSNDLVHNSSAALSDTTDATIASASDHHHHDFNLSIALLAHHSKSPASASPVQNPSVLPVMRSAEPRAQLRPPQA